MADASWRIGARKVSARLVAGLVVVVVWSTAGCGGLTGPAQTPSVAIASSLPASVEPEPSPSPVGGTPIAPDSVVAIDAATGDTIRTIDVGGDPLLLTIAGGQVWTLDFQPGTLSRIDPATFEPSVVTLEGDAVAIGSDGNDIWVAANERFLVRLDGATGTVESSTALADERIFRLRDAGFLAVEGGEVWMTIPVVGIASAPQTLWRIEASTGSVLERYPLPRDPLTPLVADGVVWVPALGSSGLVRIEPSTGDVRDVHLGDLPLSIASGAGSIWVALERSRTVVRLDPSDGELQAEVRVDTPPRGVVFGGDRVWVATEGGLSEIDPASDSVVRELRLVEVTRSAGGTDVGYLDDIVWVSIE